jgi:glycosyltransferase involved in cell wall biosynthesis
VDRLVLVGRLDPRPGRWHYRIPEGVEFAPLPHYPALSQPLVAARGMAGSLRRFWRALDEVDAVWLLGPHPLALAFAALAAARRRRVVLGVRQHLPAYARKRHPGKRGILAAALVLEAAFRVLSRLVPVVAVGPDLARRYGRGARVLATSVSLVSERELRARSEEPRPYDGELRVLSVGRLDAEKNPLLLADVLAELSAGSSRWRLVVCGEGPLAGELERRLGAMGVADRAELHGYVPVDAGLLELYRKSHVFLHVSWTEGFPQVLIEAFAAGVPVVGTAVGGVPEVVGGAALLVPPGDARAAAAAVARVAEEPALRERLVADGLVVAQRHTIEGESRRVAEFIAGA